MAIVYITTNLVNGKLYIGSSDYNNKNYFGSGVLIKKALKKYGKLNFQKDILWEGDDLKLKQSIEEFLLNEFDVVNNQNFYNRTNKYLGRSSGYKVPQWVKDKYTHVWTKNLLSGRQGFDKNRTWLDSDIGKAHIKQLNAYINTNKDIINKRNQSLRDKYKVVDHHMKDVPKTEEWKQSRRKPVLVTFPDGKQIKYDSTKDASNSVKVAIGKMFESLKNNQPISTGKYKGFMFSYFKDTH
jgi:hypothetical protein